MTKPELLESTVCLPVHTQYHRCTSYCAPWLVAIYLVVFCHIELLIRNISDSHAFRQSLRFLQLTRPLRILNHPKLYLSTYFLFSLGMKTKIK